MLDLLVENVSDRAIFLVDLGGVILSWNHGAEVLTGWSGAEAIGRLAGFLYPLIDIAAGKPIDDLDAAATCEAKQETWRVRKDGSAFWAHVTTTAIRSPSGQLVGYGQMFDDITVRQASDSALQQSAAHLRSVLATVPDPMVVRDRTEKRRADFKVQELQSELLHVSRLSAMGTMASTLAHELNQPLTAIVNYLEAARELLDGYEANPQKQALLREAVGESIQQALRAGAVVRRLRDFASCTDVAKRVEDLPALIEEGTRLSLIDVGEREVRTAYSMDPSVRTVLVDRVQIQQVLISLVRNTVEATGPEAILISTVAGDANMVIVSVQASGPCLDPVLASKLSGELGADREGSLGSSLSICRTIVEAHGGRLWAEICADGGAAFHFTIMRGENDVTHG